MSECHHKKKCEEYLKGEKKLKIEAYTEYLASPFFQELNKSLEEQDQQKGRLVDKVLQKSKQEKL